MRRARFRSLPLRRARRVGFGIVEVIVALVVFAIGALGAAALTAHAARVAAIAQRREAATLQATMLLDSLLAAEAPVAGSRTGPAAEFRWRIVDDAAGRQILVEAVPGDATRDTIRLAARRTTPLPTIAAW